MDQGLRTKLAHIYHSFRILECLSIIQGDCLQELPKLQEGSIDLIVTDPPYGYQFMGKDWDKVVPSVSIWKECLRVLKPGAFAYIMSSPRQDVLARMIVNLQDAGFETNFTFLAWAYASGFPKAANVGKLVDKRNGRDWHPEVKDYLNKQRSNKGLSFQQINEYLETATNGGGVASAIMGDKQFNELPTVEVYNKLKTLLELDNRFDDLIEREEAEREVIESKTKADSTIFTQNVGGRVISHSTYDITKAATPAAQRLDGSYAGYQPKPALECILVCMKPLSEKTYVDQALSNGKGISWFEDIKIPDPLSGEKRFPANLLVSDKILDGSSHFFSLDAWAEKTLPFLIVPKASRSEKNEGLEESKKYKRLDPIVEEKPLTTQIRKYYPNQKEIAPYLSEWIKRSGLTQKQIKAHLGYPLDSGVIGHWITTEVQPALPTPEDWVKLKEILGFDDTHDRIMTEMVEVPQSQCYKLTKFVGTRETFEKIPGINHHPTVKPVKLMSYLITMGSRPNDTILDPFCGSGTTGIAALQLGRRFLGMELSEEYCEIARKRLQPYLVQTRLLL